MRCVRVVTPTFRACFFLIVALLLFLLPPYPTLRGALEGNDEYLYANYCTHAIMMAIV